MSVHLGASIEVHGIMLWHVPSGESNFSRTAYWSAARFTVDQLLLWSPFHPKSDLTVMYSSPEAGCWNICSGLKKSTQVNCTRKHNNSFAGSSQGSELSPTLKKKISVSLISAKWHTKRKLTIGCYLPSQSDSHFPASLSPCGCQADCSLPISFGPRQPKKALPHRATTSSLFWY